MAQPASEQGQGRGARLVRLWPYAALLLCIVVPYANSVPNGFVWDDNYQLATRPPERLDLWQLFSRPSWMALSGEGSSSSGAIDTYRPLLLLSFVADAALHGDAAWGWHLTNLILFALLGLALLAVLRALVPAKAALAIAVLYCTQPLLTESVSWISGRHDVLMALLVVVDLLCLCRAAAARGRARVLWHLAALVAFALALLSKEPAMLLPLVLVPLLWLSPLSGQFPSAQRVGIVAAHALLAGLLLYHVSENVAQGDMVGGSAGAFAALQVAPWIATRYMLSFVYVPHLTSHYLQPRVAGFSLLTFWLPAFAHAALLAFAYARRHRHWPLLTGLVLYYVALAPSAVMIASKPEYSLRFLFLPSLGLLAAAAVPVAALLARGSAAALRVARAGLAALLVLQAARIHLRNRDYEDDGAFYASVITDVPESPVGYYGLGIFLHKQRRLDAAEIAYREAIARGADGKVYNNLGALLLERGRLDEAQAVLLQGIARMPRNARLHFNLGTVRMLRGDLQVAERDLLRAIALDPKYRKAYRQLYDLYRATDQARASAFRERHAELL